MAKGKHQPAVHPAPGGNARPAARAGQPDGAATLAQPATHLAPAAGFRISGCVDLTIQPEAAPRFLPTTGATIPDVRVLSAAPVPIPRQTPFVVIAQANGCTASTLQAWFIAIDEDSSHDLPGSVALAAGPRQFTLTFDTTRLTSGANYALQVSIVPSGGMPVASDGWAPIPAGP